MKLALLVLGITAILGTEGRKSCQLTTSDMEGPFYEAGAPNTIRVIPESQLEWPTTMEVSGRVLDQRCRPIAGARVDIWYAGGNDRIGGEARYSFPPSQLFYRGHRHTQHQTGEYYFLASFPGVYDERPIPHLHMKVTTSKKTFITQVYFKGQVPPGYENYVKGRETQFPKYITTYPENGRLNMGFDIVMQN